MAADMTVKEAVKVMGYWAKWNEPTVLGKAWRTILTHGYAPEGFAVVPREPTVAMQAIMIETIDANRSILDGYRAMLAAAHKEKP